MKWLVLIFIYSVGLGKLLAQVPSLGRIPVFANIDSLKKTLPQKNGLPRLYTLLSLEKSIALWETEGVQTTYVDQIKNELKRFPAAQGHYWYFNAKQISFKHNSEKAFTDSKSAYEFYKVKYDSVGMVSALLNMGIILNNHDANLPKKLKFGSQYLSEAIALSQHSHSVELRILYCYALARLSLIGNNPGKITKLINEVKAAITLIGQHPQYIYYKPFLLSTLSIIYEQKQQFALAQYYTLQILNIIQKYGVTIPVSLLYNVGFYYEMQQKYEPALRYYREAMTRSHSYPTPPFQMQWNISAGIHTSLVGLKKYREAAPWADSIYTYAEQYNHSAFKTKFQEAIASYEVEKKEAQNQLLIREKKLAEVRSKLYLGLGAFVTLILLSIVFFYYRLKLVNTKLQKALHEINELNRVRDYLFGVIAHDLRSPFTRYQDMAELVSYYLTSHQFDKLEKIAKSINQMGKDIRLLLDNLLNWALTQREEVPYRPEKFLLGKKINSIAKLYQQTATPQKVQINVECPDDLMVYMDPQACDLIVRNLVDNALKNSNVGGEILLKASLKVESCQVQLVIKDNGKGMSPEKLTAVQETILQLDKQFNIPYGMGLKLVGRFSKSNHLIIQVDSVLGSGTSFTLVFPRLDKNSPDSLSIVE